MDIKQYIEQNISKMNSPEKVYDLFNSLGYKTLSLSYQGKDAFGLKAKDKEFVNKIYAVSNYDKRFQIFLVELKSFSRDLFKSLSLYGVNDSLNSIVWPSPSCRMISKSFSDIFKILFLILFR